MPPSIDPKTLCQSAVINIAKTFVGAKEVGGDNLGEVISGFQKAVDGKAKGEKWCMCFVQFCVLQATELVRKIYPSVSLYLPKYEHSLTCWNNTYPYPHLRSKTPQVGSVVIWQYFKNGQGTQAGHTGIVISVDGETFETIEGNTSAPDGEIDPNGDGVYLKKRSMKGSSAMKVVGFILPWG